MSDPVRTVLITAALLGGLCLVLVGPGPWWVVRWRFLTRVPRAAVVLWQAGTVAALTSVLIAGVLVGHRLLTGLIPRAGWPLAWSAVIVAFAAVVVARLAWSLATVARATNARRARHRAAVDLLDRADRVATAAVTSRATLAGLRVLAGSTPLAYCLPGVRGHRVVLSEGTLDRLDHAELTAVLAHESAHVQARHDIVVDTFTAVHRAFPIAVRSEIPARECALLIEMLADDAACRVIGPLPLARALVAMAGSPVPHAALGAGQVQGLTQRIARLGPDRPGYTRRLSAAVYVLAATLVCSPFLVILTARAWG